MELKTDSFVIFGCIFLFTDDRSTGRKLVYWPVVRTQVLRCQALPRYGTRGTRRLQRLRTWGPSVFGPLQLLRLTAIFP